jgi:putative ABC transport system permease protein
MLQDLRYAVRMLFKHKGFTAAAVLTLALGIGANTAIFTVVNAVLLRPLPFPAPDRLITLTEQNLQRGQTRGVVSPRNLEDWEKQSQTIEVFGAWRDWRFKLTTSEGNTLVRAAIASPGLFRVLGLKPVLGRTFLPEENQPGRDRVVVISHGYWQSQFGGDPKVLNAPIILDNQRFTILGVLPPEMESLWLGRFDIWAPLSVDPDQYLERHLRNRRVYARIKPDVTLRQVRVEMDTIAQRLAQQYPDVNTGWNVQVTSLHQDQVGDLGSILLVFLGAVGLVLLIACAIVANRLLARAAARRREFAIRAALGAGRLRIIRQLLTESLVLAGLGGVAGLGLAYWLTDAFIALSPTALPRAGEIKLDGVVLGFTSLLSFLTGWLFGSVPALQAARQNLVARLKDGTADSFSIRGFRLHGLLVVSQMALAVALLIGAALLAQTFYRLTTLSPGYNTRNLLTVSLFLPDRYGSRDAVATFYQQVSQEFKAIPGVQSVAAASAGPQFGGTETIEISVDGNPPSASGGYPEARYFDIGAGYFRTLEIPVLRGREFTERDTVGTPGVVIINETLAKRFWPNEDPVGKRLTLARRRETLEIVGVVGDVKRYSLEQGPKPELYWPNLQKPRWASFFAFRTSGDPAAIVTAIRQRVQRLDPDVQVVNVSTLDRYIATALKQPRFNLLLLGAFALTALLLATIGLNGVVSYSVAQRTHEIGIRMALGAQRNAILKLIIRQGMWLVLTGVILGIVVSLGLTRLLRGLLLGVSATDPATFAAIAVLLIVIAMLACYLPARRATRLDPLVALRHE